MRIFLTSVVLACSLLIAGCGRQSVSGITVDPAFRTLITPETKLLSGIEWDALKSSPFYQRHQKDLNIPVFNAAAERMGVDPLRDVSKLLVASNGKDWLFIERGRFNATDLQKKIIANGAQTTTYRNHTLLGDTGTTLVFFKNIAVEGGPTSVRRAIDLENAGDGEIPEELQERLRTLSKHDQLWTVSRGGLAFANLPSNSDMQTALSNITGSVNGTTAGLYIDTGLHLSIDLDCVSPQGATRVHDALRGAIGFGRLSTKDDQQDLLRAYDAIQVTKDNQIVRVRADLPGDLADKLIATVTSFKRSQ
jgi:hypothetical protein